MIGNWVYSAWLSLGHVELGHPVYATYLILGMSIWQKFMDFLLTLNRLKLMIGSAIVVYLLFMFLIFTIDLEILCNAYGSLLPFPSFSFFTFGFIISWSSFLSIYNRCIQLALNMHMLRQGSLLLLMALLWETPMGKKWVICISYVLYKTKLLHLLAWMMEVVASTEQPERTFGLTLQSWYTLVAFNL